MPPGRIIKAANCSFFISIHFVDLIDVKVQRIRFLIDNGYHFFDRLLRHHVPE